MTDWYLAENGRQVGPVRVPHLVDLLRGKDLSRVMVWRAGFQGWVPAEDIPDIRDALALSAPVPTSPPVTPRRRRKWSWAHNLALLGAFLTAAQLAFGPGHDELPQETAEALGFAFGSIGAVTLFAAVTGFVLGWIADLGRGKPARRPEGLGASRNLFIRFWRGALPLWVSFWGSGLTLGIAVATVPSLTGILFGTKTGFSPLALFFALLTSVTVLLALLAWHGVGIWRSARRYETERDASGRNSTFAGLAKAAVSVVVACVGLIVAMAGAPDFAESYRMAFRNDPDIAAYAIRVTREGTEMEIRGGIKFGLARDMEQVLAANPNIRLVHLSSRGGRVGEAQVVHRLLRAHRLDTYVSSECLSACTMVFAGGRQRYLREGAQLGFHRGIFAGREPEGADVEMREVFLASGFDPDFAERAASVPNREMWKPPSDTLLAARVVTRVTDGGEFATSGVADPTKTKDIADRPAADPTRSTGSRS